MTIPAYVTRKRAMELLEICPQTIRDLLASGRLSRCAIGETKSGPVWRISRESLRDYAVEAGLSVVSIDQEPDFLTMKDVSRLTGRSMTTAFMWVTLGLLPSVVSREMDGPQALRSKTYRKIPREAYEAFRQQHAASLESKSRKKCGQVKRVKTPRPPKPAKPKPPPYFDSVRFISQTEAAKILGVSQALILRLIDQGLIPTVAVDWKGVTMRRIDREVYVKLAPSLRVRPRLTLKGRLSIGMVAKACGLPANTVGKWVEEGLLPAVQRPGGWRMVEPKDYEDFAKSRGLPPYVCLRALNRLPEDDSFRPVECHG